MKTTTLLIAMLTFVTIGFGQQTEKDQQDYKTLFGSENMSYGAYGGLSVNYSQVDGRDALLVGARGVWIINHSLGIGFAGNGFANDMQFDRTINGIYDNYSLAGGYGGLLIEPIIGAKYPVHVSVPVLIGAGGIAYINNYWNSYDNYYSDPHAEDANAFFVIEPGLELELNMVKFMRLAIGGYYRYTSDLSLIDTPSDVLNGFSAGVTLKFGKF